MKKKIYIRGSKEHPERVKQALIDHGGRTDHAVLSFDHPDSIYRISEGGYVVEVPPCWITEVITSHPDWEEIYPEPYYKFKVGDIVTWHCNGDYEITALMNVDGEPYYILGHQSVVAEDDLTLSPPPILTWKDMEKNDAKVDGYWIGAYSDISHFSYIAPLAVSSNRNVFRTEAQARSALAMAQISQLIEQEAYGGWCPIGEEAVIIDFSICGEINVLSDTFHYDGHILRFHTREQAELFLTHNRQLVEDYLMINDHFREPAKKTEKGDEV